MSRIWSTLRSTPSVAFLVSAMPFVLAFARVRSAARPVLGARARRPAGFFCIGVDAFFMATPPLPMRSRAPYFVSDLLQPVPVLIDRGEAPAILAVEVELLAQPADVRVDRARRDGG